MIYIQKPFKTVLTQKVGFWCVITGGTKKLGKRILEFYKILAVQQF